MKKIAVINNFSNYNYFETMYNATPSDSQKKRGQCIIKGCVNHVSRYTTMFVPYYAFPPVVSRQLKSQRRSIWIQRIVRHNKFDSDWQPKVNSVICNLHFVGGKKSEHPLHPAYNPTQFPSQKVVEANQVQQSIEQMQEIVNEWSEDEEPSSTKVSTVGHIKLKKQKRKRLMIKDTRSNVVLVRDDFADEPMKFEEDDVSSNDSKCQDEFEECELSSDSPVNSLISGLKDEKEINYEKTQVDMKKSKCGSVDLESSGSDMKSSSLEYLWAPKSGFGGISTVRSNNNLLDMCGLNFKQFNFVMHRISDIAKNSTTVIYPNRLFITLVKLRQGLSYAALGVYFTMQPSLVQEIFNETLPFLKEFAVNRVAWIKKGVIQNHVPEIFQPDYSKCRGMIDCIEVQVELPQSAEAQKEYYKNFKSCNTFKFFMACAPNGFIMYRSKCYGGQKADGLVAQDCGFLDLIKSDDIITTDREFSSLEVAISNKDASLKKIDVTIDSELFPLYMHIRESLNQLKHFKILSAMPMDQLEHVDSIVQICCSLVNLHFLMSVPNNNVN